MATFLLFRGELAGARRCAMVARWLRDGSVSASGPQRFLTADVKLHVRDTCATSDWYKKQPDFLVFLICDVRDGARWLRDSCAMVALNAGVLLGFAGFFVRLKKCA